MRLPGSERSATLELVRDEDGRDPRAAPFRWNPPEGARIERLHAPVPHIVLRRGVDPADRVSVLAFRRIRGNPLRLSLLCDLRDFDDAYADFLEATATLEADLAFWPPVPDDYKTKKKGRYLIAVHPSVRSTREIERVLRDRERSFVKMHGKLPKPDRNAPVVIYVHSDKSQARAISEEAAGSRDGFYEDHRHGRLFVVTTGKDDRAGPYRLAYYIHGLLLRIQYGRFRPMWFFTGERSVAAAEQATGRALPYLSDGYTQWMIAPLRPLRELEEGGKQAPEDAQKQSFWYVALFRAGPTKFRKAYRDFLEECAETYDTAAAFERHLAPLGLDEIKSAAEQAQSSVKLIHVH